MPEVGINSASQSHASCSGQSLPEMAPLGGRVGRISHDTGSNNQHQDEFEYVEVIAVMKGLPFHSVHTPTSLWLSAFLLPLMQHKEGPVVSIWVLLILLLPQDPAFL